jgi:hypothetical protein
MFITVLISVLIHLQFNTNAATVRISVLYPDNNKGSRKQEKTRKHEEKNWKEIDNKTITTVKSRKEGGERKRTLRLRNMQRNVIILCRPILLRLLTREQALRAC